MKLYYSHRSPYVRLVMVAVHWCGLADRIALMNTIVDIYAPHKLLIRDNPLTKVPTLLLDDGTALYDSRVICEYLDGCHDGPKLYPGAGLERLQALRRQALGIGTIDLLLSWLLERNRPDEGRSQPFIDAVLIKYRAVLDRLEAEAGDLASSPFSIGHAAIGTALSYSDFRFGSFDWRAEHDALAAWHADFLKIPAVAADPFFDDLAAAAATKAEQEMAALAQGR
jgi:glutathione S-transferase